MRCIFRKTGRFTTMAENHILTFDNGYGSMMDIQYFNGLEEYNGTILLVQRIINMRCASTTNN